MSTCTGSHYTRDLPSEGVNAWLMLCTGCREATLVIGHRAVDTFATAQEAETEYKNRITQGAIR